MKDFFLMGAVYIAMRFLEEIAKRTRNKWDDRIVKYLKDFLSFKYFRKNN